MDMAPEALELACAQVADGALTAARLAAATQLLTWLADNGFGTALATAIGAQGVVDIFEKREADPRYAGLKPFEEQWMLLVVQLADAVSRPGRWSPDALAVEDARGRGVTWKAIAAALAITPQSAHTRYRVVKPRASGGRRGPRPVG